MASPSPAAVSESGPLLNFSPVTPFEYAICFLLGPRAVVVFIISQWVNSRLIPWKLTECLLTFKPWGCGGTVQPVVQAQSLGVSLGPSPPSPQEPVLLQIRPELPPQCVWNQFTFRRRCFPDGLSTWSLPGWLLQPLAAFLPPLLSPYSQFFPATSKGTITDVNHTTCSYAPNPPCLSMEFRQKLGLLWPWHLSDLAPVIFLTSFSCFSLHCLWLDFSFLARPAELCLRLCSPWLPQLPPSLSPLAPITQAFTDYVCEVTSILSTSIFFISFVALLSKQPFCIYLPIHLYLPVSSIKS